MLVALKWVIALAGIILCFVWYDWKLFVILFLLLWANNISISEHIK